MTGPRVALLGFSIECNRFAPVTQEGDFTARTLLGGRRCWPTRAPRRR